VLHFEEIVDQPQSVIQQIGSILGLTPAYKRPYLPKKIKQGGRLAAYWRRLTRQFESTAILGRYNGEDPQDWCEAFTQDDRRFFHQEAGDVLIELGYVSDHHWIEKAHRADEH
jgi:hypothetical protein